MSVYSKFSEDQLNELSDAIGGEVSGLGGIEGGISNTIYKAAVDFATREEKVVIVIHETPDQISHGTPAEKSRNIPDLMFYAATNIEKENIRDVNGELVQTVIPMPYLWDFKDTSRTMKFKHATIRNQMVDKTVSVLPFMEGKELDWSISKCQNEDIIRQAGRGLAALHKAVEGFPNADSMDNMYGYETWMGSVDSLLNNSDTEGKLNTFLSRKNASYMAMDVLRMLEDEADFIEENWEKRTKNLPKNITHGDYFPDNTMIAHSGKQVIFDFGNSSLEVEAYDVAMSINAWASENGVFIQENIDAFLDGYNSVKPLSTEEMQQLAFLGRVASFSRALLRIDIALNAKDPDHANSPEDCLVQLEHWQKEDEEKNVRYLKGYHFDPT